MIYEGRAVRPIPRAEFLARMAKHGMVSAALVVISLGAGMAGYEYYEKLAWRDAFLNAAMLLGGMGPVDAPETNGGKLFAGLYALYAGLIFLVVAAILIAPVIHRIQHHLHWEEPKTRG